MSKGEQTKQAIVDEAMGLVSTLGLSGLTIGSLANVTGMSKSGLFAHFRSKEQLQLSVLEAARARYERLVVRPAFKAPRGEPRLRAIFKNTIQAWEDDQPGGCIFYAVSAELDDQPGAARDYLIEIQQLQVQMLRRSVEMAIEEGHFRADLDIDQFLFELGSITAGYHHFGRLLGDRDAGTKASRMFDSLVARAK